MSAKRHRKPKFKPRKGLTVVSAYDPRYSFTIDKSFQPERLFREKGTSRWWAKSELRRFIGDDLPPKPLSAERQTKALGEAQMAIMAAMGHQLNPTALPKQLCKGCPVKFRPPDKRVRKFHSVECERAYAKRKADAAQRPKPTESVVTGSMEATL